MTEQKKPETDARALVIGIAIGALRGTDSAGEIHEALDLVHLALERSGVLTSDVLAAEGIPVNRALRRALARYPLVSDAWRETVLDRAVAYAGVGLTLAALQRLDYVAVSRCSASMRSDGSLAHGGWVYGGRYLSREDALADGWSGVCWCGKDMRHRIL